MSFTLRVHFFIGFRNVFFPRTFNRKKRLREEREERLHCKEKKIGRGPKLYGKAGHFMVWANGKKKKNLACETKVEKGVCLQRLAKFSLHNKRFQSSYCAKVVAKANLKWSGEGEGRRGNACPRTP